MAWDDATEILVAGGGEVSVAPVGTTAPTTAVAALNAAFVGLGFHTEDGVTVNNAPDILEIRAWQSQFPIRTERQTEDFRITFVLQQWNETNLPLAFGGGAVVSDGGTGYKFSPPVAGDAMDYRALVVDVRDGSRHGRFVIPRGAAIEGVESQFSRTAEAQLPITFQANPLDASSSPWSFFTDDAAAFAPGS